MRFCFSVLALALLGVGCSDEKQQRIGQLEKQIEEKRLAELEEDRKRRLEL